jgi:signal transduction histidine kinase/FixJ family two-component response regulator
MTERQKILIVDDRRENLVALRQVLREVDAEVIEAASGNEALAATLDHDFAVALLDVQMPGMTGYELAEHLRGEAKTRRMPIVFLTACYADEQHVFQGYAAGGIDYITKPYLPEVLQGKVNAFLEMAHVRRELEVHRDRLETLVAERTHLLNARAKELTCLYSLSNLVAQPRASIDASLSAAVDLIPPGYQYPEIARARITFAGAEFASPGFRETPWKQSADIVASGVTRGSVAVCYLEETPAITAEPFIAGERDLIIAIGRHLGFMIQHTEAEAVLIAANVDLKRLDHLKTSFVSTVSHELRTPLAIAKEAIHLLLDKIPGETNEQQDMVLRTAGDHIDRLESIIDDLLDIAKIEAGKLRSVRTPVNIAALARRAVDGFQARAARKNIALTVTASTEDVTLYADADKVMEIFSNLIANAITFTEAGAIDIRITETADAVECAVADSGVGISDEDLPDVFGKFQQFGRVAGPGPKGTGLGLAIVKGLVELHRGSIRVESTLGKGTTFTFTLPRYAREQVAIEKIAELLAQADQDRTRLGLIVIRLGDSSGTKEEKKGKIEELQAHVRETLREIRLLRSSDVILEGGENESILLVRAKGDEECRSVLERLRGEIRERIVARDESADIGVSYGYCLYPDEAASAGDLLMKARASHVREADGQSEEGHGSSRRAA